MRLRAVLASAVLLMSAAGCGDGAAEPGVSPSPTPAESATAPSPESSTAPQSSADLELAPGRIGPVSVGTSKDDAAATGLFDVDVTGDEPCESRPLAWKSQFTGTDVLTDEAGSIVSLGVGLADGPRTATGLGVGSTFGELIELYGGDLSAPETAGYGQVGVFVQDGDDWLGFLLGEATTVEQVDNDPAFKVTFAEATKFAKPGLIRDGC